VLTTDDHIPGSYNLSLLKSFIRPFRFSATIDWRRSHTTVPMVTRSFHNDGCGFRNDKISIVVVVCCICMISQYCIFYLLEWLRDDRPNFRELQRSRGTRSVVHSYVTPNTKIC
jgi:hypothetical protein